MGNKRIEKHNTMKDYKKLYEDAIEKIRKGIQPLQDGSKVSGVTKGFLEEVFPELCESEDEGIRKSIIAIINNYVDNSNTFKPKMLAWLEKQGEFKSIDSDDLATLEIWEDFIKENKEKWQLSDWFVESTSLLIQKVKRMDNNENINIKDSRVMLNACINALRTVGHSHLSDWLEKQGDKKFDCDTTVEWHREDEQNLNACLGYIPDEFLRRWLKDIIHIKYDKTSWGEEDRTMAFTLMRDVDQMSYISKEGKNERLEWLNSLEDRFNNV